MAAASKHVKNWHGASGAYRSDVLGSARDVARAPDRLSATGTRALPDHERGGPTGAPSLPVTRNPFAHRVAFRDSRSTSAMVGGEGVDRHHCSVKLSRANGRAVNALLSRLAMRDLGEKISWTLGHTIRTGPSR